MKKLKKFIFKNIRSIVISVVIIGLFIFASWLSRSYVNELSSLSFMGIYGELAYVLLSFIGAAAAGISSTPLIPLAYVVWGGYTTVALTVIGWTGGSLVAFWLSRRFGEALACRLINVCDIEDYRRRIKSRGLFWKLLLARIFLPVDVLSYAMGLFTKMPWYKFVLATLIGSTIFTTLAIAASTLPVVVQTVLSVLILFIFFYWLKNFIKTTFIK